VLRNLKDIHILLIGSIKDMKSSKVMLYYNWDRFTDYSNTTIGYVFSLVLS